MEKGKRHTTIKNQRESDDSLYIRKLIAQGEHQQLDFKFAITDSRKIARTMIAFANTDGGKLLIGVKDNGIVAGVRSDEEYYMIEAAADLYCKPSITFKATRWLVDGKIVLEVDIKKSARHCLAKDEKNNWSAYVRVKDQNILANTVLLKYWQRRGKSKPTLVAYSKIEKQLLQYLTEHPNITIDKFKQLVHINQTEAEQVLVDLLCLDLIKIHIEEKTTFYTLYE
jgi:predicted HTH transcriptional regulator